MRRPQEKLAVQISLGEPVQRGVEFDGHGTRVQSERIQLCHRVAVDLERAHQK